MSAYPALQTGINFSKLFEPDALISAQFYSRTRRTYHAEPELRLMAAILEDAVVTLTRDPRRCTDQRRRDFADALDWIARPEENGWLFSFASICESLGIDPIHLRQRVAAKNRRDSRQQANHPRKGPAQPPFAEAESYSAPR